MGAWKASFMVLTVLEMVAIAASGMSKRYSPSPHLTSPRLSWHQTCSCALDKAGNNVCSLHPVVSLLGPFARAEIHGSFFFCPFNRCLSCWMPSFPWLEERRSTWLQFSSLQLVLVDTQRFSTDFWNGTDVSIQRNEHYLTIF